MITQYTWPTPNGHKVSILIAELGLENEVVAVDINAGAQCDPDFLKFSPNNRIPAIVDHDPADGGEPVSVFETGAILIYLADKAEQFLPPDLRGQIAATEWLMWQMGGLGPMMGQHGHFKLYAPERIAYATDRYRKEVLRLFGVMDRRLADNDYLAGEEYSIADIACFPWVQTYKRQEIDLEDFPDVQRWYETLKQRKGLRRGMALGRDRINRNPQDDAQTRPTLFGLDE